MPMNEYGEIIRNSSPPPPIPPFNNNNNNGHNRNNSLIIGIVIGIVIAVSMVIGILLLTHRNANSNNAHPTNNQNIAENSYSENNNTNVTTNFNGKQKNTTSVSSPQEQTEEKSYPIGYVITKTDPLNIRENANISGKVIGSIPKGNEVTIISESGDWYEVNYCGKRGYVSKTYISFNKNDIPKDEVPVNSELKYGKVNTEKDPLNVRKQPSIDSKVIGTVPKGSKITIVGESDDWYTINYSNGIGYVAKKYIIITE